VEDEETIVMLRSFGVDCVQGYYLEKPSSDHPLLVARVRRPDASVALRLT
jgi:EAL domain-containing protein (putative c-di-GMP-specific phosphodiesterase class I)